MSANEEKSGKVFVVLFA